MGSINSVRWLRNIADVKNLSKTELRMEEGYVCVAGAREDGGRGYGRVEGLFATYKVPGL